MYGLELLAPPTAEPVDLATLKAHLRLNLDDEDALLSAYLTAARQLFEGLTGRQLLTATWKLHLDAWPQVIYFPKPPLQEVVSVSYLDGWEEERLWLAGNYVVDAKREPGRLYPVNAWPAISTKGKPAVNVIFKAGAATASAVPALVKQAIMLLAATYYERRESLQEKALVDLPMGFRAIVDQYRTGVMGSWGMA